MFAYGQNKTNTDIDKNNAQLQTNLQDKYYRQALFYYFQDDPSKALSQMEQNKARLNTLDSRSALFESGLQLSSGLLQQAKTTLVNFDSLLSAETAKLTNEEAIEKSHKKALKAKELRLIALLSLSNQYLSKGDYGQAQDTLEKISWMSASYYQEYHVLNQLAYWPEKNRNMLANPDENQNQHSPYIQLNDALRLIELAQQGKANFSEAIEALKAIKVTQWHEGEENFWKTLFINDAIYSSQYSQADFAELQGQAIQDYAQLLLAQIYISEEQYQLAFNELQSFPEHSPYTESALFLFAFASQQVKQFTMSLNLLNLLYKDYPYSPLAWQSAELMAQQVSDENSLAQGVTAYHTVESFFLERQQSLKAFSQAFNRSDNLLEFSGVSLTTDLATGISTKTLSKNTLPLVNSSHKKQYLPESMWLQQALFNVELATLYNNLMAIDEQVVELKILADKASWIAEVIKLNQNRKQQIIAAQVARDQSGVFSKLTTDRHRLAAILSKELATQDNTAFANDDEKDWLARITRSQQALIFIGDQKETSEYQERLARVKGVLSWQLAEQYPARSWSHTKQLQQVDKAITAVRLQQQQVDNIASSQDSLTKSIKIQKHSVEKVTALLARLTLLREKMSASIRVKVNAYIEDQGAVLAEHLLTTRQGMAKVLERMAHEDKRLSLKLAPTASGAGR